MGRQPVSQQEILGALVNGEVLSSRQIGEQTSLSKFALWEALRRGWVGGLLLRSEKPIYERERLNKGRAGRPWNTRPYHVYSIKPQGVDHIEHDGSILVTFSDSVRDPRGGNGGSKAKKILDFLKSQKDEAFYSTDIVKALKDFGVRAGDIMANLRRYEQKGIVYIRGYRGHDRQTPFKEGFMVTWIEQDEDRDKALLHAIDRVDKALSNRESTNIVIQRIHRVRDRIVESSRLRDLASFAYIQDCLGCSEKEAENAAGRALQLYPDLLEIKLFNAYRYFYHESLSGGELDAAVELKRRYVRKMGSRRFRIGHNWEAVAEWFIDRFTPGAEFLSQQHRTPAIDPRRITLRLVKSIRGRRNAAEVDRVWKITPGLFATPITYVLSCKSSIVHKDDVDDFLEVMRWSKEFGVDTPDGRQVRPGVMGVFAAGAFDPKEHVKIKDGTTIPLATYAVRMNIQLYKASDFNEKLHERGCPSFVSVQKVRSVAKDEKEVRQVLDLMWKDPLNSEEILMVAERRNKELYELEKSLEVEPYMPAPDLETSPGSDERENEIIRAAPAKSISQN